MKIVIYGNLKNTQGILIQVVELMEHIISLKEQQKEQVEVQRLEEALEAREAVHQQEELEEVQRLEILAREEQQAQAEAALDEEAQEVQDQAAALDE